MMEPTTSPHDLFRAFFESRVTRVVLCLLLIGMLFANSQSYRTRHGFDAGSHTAYAEYLSLEGALPTFDVAYVSYNPPVFYLYGAAVFTACRWLGFDPFTSYSEIDEKNAPNKSRDVAKMLVSLAVGLIGIMLMLFCKRLFGKTGMAAYLVCLISIPAFFKASAMYSPEPFLTVLVWLAMLIALADWGERWDLSQAILAGILSGLAIWTRPFGFAVAGAWGLMFLFALIFWRRAGIRWIRKALIIGVISAIAAVALFAFNHQRFGKAMARPRNTVAMYKPHSMQFYFGIAPATLFTRPQRPELGDRFLPIIYSDLWGDYWKKWALNDRLDDSSFNKSLWRRLLGIQNALALLPTVVLLAGLVALIHRAVRAGPEDRLAPFLPVAFLLLVGGAFFLYFVLSTPAKDLNQVKALYIHFLLPIIPFGGAWAISGMIEGRRREAILVIPYLLLFASWSFLLFCHYPHGG